MLTTAERAQDLAKPPVYILGVGYAQSAYFTGSLAKGDKRHGFGLTSTVGRWAADMAFEEAGIERKDIDLAEIYDSFTITALIQLEDAGFCKKGEGGSFVESGRIEIGGELPINTHGGLHSCAHFGPGGFLHYGEAVRQLRGEGGQRQVKGAKTAFVSSAAGIISTHTAAILGREEN